ncbi:MerR family transcriptional regulator [Robertmurraya andreesenii]|uniref:MerR family transcriptional activator of bmr protein n=1 Tax=Anoxybacillus andreesenii TaxID=1325932 RepID=A0ABT9V479_9BACL|nr:MerR family transcriptional regulator [Robertmurraya andreesenii]MDQ0155752.1 MerR family transcriptional activator of bmr gene [Robertmurraya andreesenii]
MKDTYYSIGEVAKLANVSVQTLRYYDKIGLFKPVYVEPTTKYRYYHDSQLYHLDLIKSLKYIGTSLEDIMKVQALKAEELMDFLNEQELIIENKLSRLKEIQQNVSRVKKRVRRQLNYPAFGEVVILEEDEMLILQATSNNLSPLDLLNASYSKLKRIIEEEEGIIDNSYGGIYAYQGYELVDEIKYTHLFTPLLTDKRIITLSNEMEVTKIPAGTYVGIIFTFSPDIYFSNLKKLLNYVDQYQLKVTGDIYELFMPTSYSPNEQEDYTVEIKIRLRE